MDSFEFEKENNEVMEKKEHKDLYTLFKENKTFIYSIMFYIAGLICGSLIYKKCQNDVLNEVLSATNESFLQLFINNLSVYFLFFAISILLGLCLVGFPFINFIPMFLGFETGMKIAYYYINYNVKGVGYSLLMIVPFVCFYLTIIMYSISMSFDISKNIYNITVKKEEYDEEFNYKIYLKKYLIYATIIFLVALFNTIITTTLSGIVTI